MCTASWACVATCPPKAARKARNSWTSTDFTLSHRTAVNSNDLARNKCSRRRREPERGVGDVLRSAPAPRQCLAFGAILPCFGCAFAPRRFYPAGGETVHAHFGGQGRREAAGEAHDGAFCGG